MSRSCEIIHLPKILDARGNLTFLEELKHIPFEIQRVYYIYDVPGGEIRGSHAFKTQQELIIALSGSFDILTHDGHTEQRFTLNRSYNGLYLPPMTWRTLENFSTNSVCLVISSALYDEKDYIRSKDEFLQVNKDTVNLFTPVNKKRTPTSVVKPNLSVYDAAVIEIPRISAGNGHISVVQGIDNLPFEIRRVFYLYDIPGGEDRGAHAHKQCHQFLIAASGAFEVMLDDGKNKRTVRLDRPYYGLHIPPGLWAAEQAFSSGAICLVMTSHLYTAEDYIRDYEEYLKRKNNK
jgi:hypothetical protein